MRKFKGYMTIEAALIMPMVICVFVLLIYFSYYLYGRCVMSQDTYILAFRAGRENSAEYAYERAYAVFGSKYFGSTKPTLSSVQNGADFKVTATATARHSAMGEYFLKPQSGWDYKAAGRAKRREYAEHIRRLTRIRDIGKELMD